MKDVLIIAMWDQEEEVMTRPIIVNAKTKELKLKGRKPNKIIVPESCKDKTLLRKIKSISAHNCKIVTAVGK